MVIPSRKIYTVGFSGVIFGLLVLYYSLLNQSPGVTLIGLIISIIPQLTIPGISSEGHFAGIIAGVMYILLFPIKNKKTT
jgi:rhomboid domain-containing protein 1